MFSNNSGPSFKNLQARRPRLEKTDLRFEILQTRTEYRIVANSGPSLEKKGSSLEILQTQARFLQTRDEFGNSPISDRFSPNLGLRSEILQTQFGDSPNSVRRFSKLSLEMLQTPAHFLQTRVRLQILRFSKLGLSLEILQTPNFNVFFSCRTLILPDNLHPNAYFLHQNTCRTLLRVFHKMSLEKTGLSLEILRTRARFLQTRVEFGDSPNSGPFLQTRGEFGDSPNLGSFSPNSESKL